LQLGLQRFVVVAKEVSGSRGIEAIVRNGGNAETRQQEPYGEAAYRAQHVQKYLVIREKEVIFGFVYNAIQP
jgi:hypothetical protein